MVIGNCFPGFPVLENRAKGVEESLKAASGLNVLGPFDVKLQKFAAKALRERGVELRLNTSVKEVRPDGVEKVTGKAVFAADTRAADAMPKHPHELIVGIDV